MKPGNKNCKGCWGLHDGKEAAPNSELVRVFIQSLHLYYINLDDLLNSLTCIFKQQTMIPTPGLNENISERKRVNRIRPTIWCETSKTFCVLVLPHVGQHYLPFNSSTALQRLFKLDIIVTVIQLGKQQQKFGQRKQNEESTPGLSFQSPHHFQLPSSFPGTRDHVQW